MSNSTLRVLTALVGIPVVLGVTYLGGWPFALLLLAAALIAQDELYGLMTAAGHPPLRTTGLILGALLAVRALLPEATALAAAGAVVLLAATPFLHEERAAPGVLAATFFGALYPTALLAFLVDLRLAIALPYDDGEAFLLTLSVFVLVWATDTFAYYTGKSIGRRPLAPRISPKKTWEGSIGGALGAVATAVVLKLTLLSFLGWGDIVAIALLTGVVSQLGDLAESRFKRAVGAKDSGHILPGHGGLLDRFDAMILAAPAVYLYLAFLA